MASEHINIKLSPEYMTMIRKIAKTLGIKDLSSVFGSVPLVIRFSITLTSLQLDNIYKVIPPLNPKDLDILLTSIKNHKNREYYERRAENQSKPIKKVIPDKISIK